MSNLNIKEVNNALLAMPMAKVIGAYNALSGDQTQVTKADAVQWLKTQIMDGRFNLTRVHDVATHATTPAPQASTSASGQYDLRKMNNAITSLGVSLHNAEKLLHSRIDGTQTNVTNDLDKLTQRVNDSANTLGKLQSGVLSVDLEVKALSQKIGKFSIDESQVNAAVSKVVADAFAPFRKAVEDAGAQDIVADLSSIHVVDRKTAAEVFGVEVVDIRGNPLMVDIWNHPAAPAVDPLFIWTRPILEDLLGVQETGENLWFGGDRGTGKSETARQFAARTGRNFARVNYHKHSSADEFIGAVGLENGATVFKPGSFLQAFLTPSTVILNDEISNAPEGELATLNPLLEPNCAVIYGGAVRRRAPGVMIFAADNTLGCGDESGRYAGTRTMNSALVDRFARVLHFQYLPLAEEIKAVVNHTGCTETLAEHVLSAVRVAREKVTQGEIIDAPSIRSVVAFIRALKVKQPVDAWQSCIVARQPNESRTALEAIAMTYLDLSLIKANI